MLVLPEIKKILHWMGSALAILGIVFLIIRIREYGSQIDFERFNWIVWGWAGVFSIIYGFANLMLALAWWHLLDFFKNRVSKLWAIKVYGITQLAKYVPGNIMHFAGRQAIGMAAGLPGGVLAKTTVFELGLLSIAGGVLSILALPLLTDHLSIQICILLLLAALTVTVIVLQSCLGRPLLIAFCWYLCFLIISGVLFYGLLFLTTGTEMLHTSLLLSLCGAYIAAWLAGLVTPGAPAGIGVREMVLLFLLNGLVTNADLLAVVMIGRIITVGGDAFFFALVSLGFPHNLNEKKPLGIAG